MIFGLWGFDFGFWVFVLGLDFGFGVLGFGFLVLGGGLSGGLEAVGGPWRRGRSWRFLEACSLQASLLGYIVFLARSGSGSVRIRVRVRVRPGPGPDPGNPKTPIVPALKNPDPKNPKP